VQQHEHEGSCFEQLESGLFEERDRPNVFAPNLKRFGDLSQSQMNKRVKSFGHQLWETIVEQAEKTVVSDKITLDQVDFGLEGQKYSLHFSSAPLMATDPSSSTLSHLSEEEKRNVFMVSQTLVSTKW